MTTAIERLQTALDTLRLKAVEARLESLLEQASKKEPSYADFLEELLSCEVEARRGRYLRARLQLAHLPFVKTFEQFDFSFQPSIDERQIRELCSLRFIHEASNVIFLGPKDTLECGVGGRSDSVGLRRLFHHRARSGHRLGESLSRRSVGPEDADLFGPEGSGLIAAGRFGDHDLLPTHQREVRARQYPPDLEQELR